MPISFPFPVRVSVGLAVAGVEQLRKLPGELPTLGVTAAGQAMRLSMRLQQEFADLATRGDEVLSLIGGQPAEHPAWATFDEEETDATGPVVAVVDAAAHDGTEEEDGYSGDVTQELAEVIALDLVAAAQSRDRAENDGSDAGSVIDVDAEDEPLHDESQDDEGSTGVDDGAIVDARDLEVGGGAGAAVRTPADSTDNGAVDGPDDAYEALTLAELRGRLRRLSADQVTDLLGRERAGADRPAFVTLLSNRLTSMEQGHP